MPFEVMPMVGSGNAKFRQENQGKYHVQSLAVNVVNWEDATAVGAVRASGYSVLGATRLPSGVPNLPYRRAIAIFNLGPNTILVGQSGITTSNGYPVPVNTEKAFAVAGNLDIWVIGSGAAASDVRIFEIA